MRVLHRRSPVRGPFSVSSIPVPRVHTPRASSTPLEKSCDGHRRLTSRLMTMWSRSVTTVLFRLDEADIDIYGPLLRRTNVLTAHAPTVAYPKPVFIQTPRHRARVLPTPHVTFALCPVHLRQYKPTQRSSCCCIGQILKTAPAKSTRYSPSGSQVISLPLPSSKPYLPIAQISRTRSFISPAIE